MSIIDRESMEFDVVIVGGGPAGLSSAIRLKQLSQESGHEIEICLIEKSAEIGGHLLSGAIFEPDILDDFIPDWRMSSDFAREKVDQEEILYFINNKKSFSVPHWAAPMTMKNKDNYIISLGEMCQWLSRYAEQLGVHVFSGFAAADILYDDQDTVVGVITGDMGLDSAGEKKETYQPGFALYAKYVIVSEGCRGYLAEQIIQKYKLDQDKDPQHYGLGVKEVWQISPNKHKKGLVVHSAGWPLTESRSEGGGFMYHYGDNLVSVGLITDLSYRNPSVSPFEEMQRFKTHPKIKSYLEGGKRIAYGARSLVKGGLQSLPKMSFPGGILVGDSAGTLNFAKIKGVHAAMKSAITGAEEVFEAISAGSFHADLSSLKNRFNQSSTYKELHLQRNFGPAQHKWGNLLGSAYAFIDINIFRGHLPWTLQDRQSDRDMNKSANSKVISYPKPDNILTFDRLSSVYLANISYDDDQPNHVVLENLDKVVECINLYDEPAMRYCPAQVYMVIQEEGKAPKLQINAQNCIHCKTCDIKDPVRNIKWVTPEGGSGPNYNQM